MIPANPIAFGPHSHDAETATFHAILRWGINIFCDASRINMLDKKVQDKCAKSENFEISENCYPLHVARVWRDTKQHSKDSVLV